MRKRPHGAATDGDRVGAEGKEEGEEVKKNKSKQQRPSESQTHRRSAHVLNLELPEASKLGGPEEQKAHNCVPSGHV
jgi:hypothetical protein